MRRRWHNVIKMMESVCTASTWREVNFGADKMVNYGCELNVNTEEIFDERPTFFRRLEDPFSTYYLFRNM
ncbi:hypothetical protein ACHQM5_009780 [Ranunculus cassubicifolius]